MRLLRNPREILFRLRQEAANFRDLLLPLPSVDPDRCPAPLPILPSPERVAASLRPTPFAQEIAHLAGRIRQHQFPIFGDTLETGPSIDWRRDYPGGISSGLAYFRRVPYLNPALTGDHKNVWELNRHQHLVILAQDHLLNGNQTSLETIERHLASWWEANPYLKGINWTSALEVAFRALSWLWVYHLAGHALSAPVRRRFLSHLAQHGRYLAHNLSVYFSPNTHLLGEAVALHALGTLLPGLPDAAAWRSLGRRTVLAQMPAQVRPDGGYFEQSSYYHVYALDMFLFHALLEAPPEHYKAGLRRMGELLAVLLGPDRRIPLLGDDDGGRFFYPYGRCDEFGRATLATLGLYLNRPQWSADAEDCRPQAAWWISEPYQNSIETVSEHPFPALFPDTGIASLTAGDWQCLFDFGPFGPGSHGHSHADTLSILLRRPGQELLVDAGTYTYISSVEERNRFRGTALHNTVRMEGRDQATPAGPFRWLDPPQARLLAFEQNETEASASAECRYRGWTHRRHIRLTSQRLTVRDEIEGSGAPLREQFWHFGVPVKAEGEGVFRLGESVRLTVLPPSQPETGTGGAFGWRSLVLGEKHPAPYVRAWSETPLPAFMETVFDLQF